MDSQQQRLIVFSRFPEAGTTKTRLIPALGPESAAALQRQMTEWILTQAKNWRQRADRRAVTIYFNGGTVDQMRNWLGSSWEFQPQAPGDLGEKLTHAIAEQFAKGAESIAVIGSDCPGVRTSLFEAAFEALNTHAVVLGPALDGGYYLLGLQQLYPELFEQMAWGTDAVLEQTRRVIQQLGLTSQELPALNDVDRPEDLAIWEQYRPR